MKLTVEYILLIGSILLFLSILAGKTSYKFGVPTLVFFLATGMLAGSEGIGGIYFDDPQLAQFIGVIALNIILFSGGLDTNWHAVKPILWQGVTLSTAGVLLTAASTGVFVYTVTDFTLYESLLLGSIVSSTDAAAVFGILRSRSLALKHNLKPTLELESGSNDPMAYVLTIAFTSLVLNPDSGFLSVVPVFLKQMIIGGAAGFGLAKVSKWIINQIQLDYVGLYPVLVISLMYFTFSATDFIGGNGFLAVYICAVYLGNQDIIHKKTIVKFFDGLAWLMQIGLFLTLGLLVFPSQMVPVIGIGLLVSIFLIVVARPLSVFASLAFFHMPGRSRWYISWVGLRGAVPIVFATYPLLAHVEKSQMIFNIVFFISLTSLIIQGTSLPIVARWLHVSIPETVKVKRPAETILSDEARAEFFERHVSAGSPAIGKRIVDLNFPKSAVIAMIRRDNKFLTPSGSTVIQDKDVLMILSESKKEEDIVEKLLNEPA